MYFPMALFCHSSIKLSLFNDFCFVNKIDEDDGVTNPDEKNKIICEWDHKTDGFHYYH